LNFGFSLVGVNLYCSTQVQRMVEADFTSKLREYDASIMPAAPSPAYLNSEKMNNPLAMYSGDMMTVNVNLSGLPVRLVTLKYSFPRMSTCWCALYL